MDESWRMLLQEHFATLHEVLPGLLLSGIFGVNRDDVSAAGVDFVVNCTRQLPLTREFARHSLRVPAIDERSFDIAPLLDHASDALHELMRDDRRVLVHCQAGVSRSVAVVLAFLIKWKARSLRSAYLLVAARRQVARPNSSFFQALISFEARHMRERPPSTRMIVVRHQGRAVEMPNWLYYDLPQRFLHEFLGPTALSMNEAPFLSKDQLVIDLDADPDVFTRCRHLILDTGTHAVTRLPPPPPPPPVQASRSPSSSLKVPSRVSGLVHAAASTASPPASAPVQPAPIVAKGKEADKGQEQTT